MRAWILSDLHIDSNPDIDLGEHPDVDIIVMAGDLSDGDFDAVPWMLDAFTPAERARLLFVNGNHEAYGIGLAASSNRLRDMASRTGIVPLDRGAIEIGSMRFVGCTMWSPLDPVLDGLGGDLRSIPDFGGDAWRTAHALDRAWLEATVRKGDVVITHHAPCWDGLATDMQHNVRLMALSSGYFADMTPLMKSRHPALWIHGHTHVTQRIVEVPTEVVSNARGRGDRNWRFDPGFVIDL